MQLTDKPSSRAFFSPDGKLLATTFYAEGEQSPWKVAIGPAEGRGPWQFMDAALRGRRATVQGWTPDSSAVVYVSSQIRLANLWRQPINGSKPAAITDFTSESIDGFAISRDGKSIALSRGHSTLDVVLIKDEK
jgi:Tol biopolymer transport system component